MGQRANLESILEELIRFGYQRVPQVADPGDLALRGGILDVFPATFESPLRLEWAGRHIASIRSFNPASLDTLDRHSMVVVLPRQLRMRVSSPACPLEPRAGRRTSLDADTPFEGALDLEDGDLVVHLEHGIGRFLGRTTLATGGGELDALLLEYADGDRLYVPMDQLHLVQKYVGFGSRAPALHKLGGSAWERAKTRAYLGAWTYAKDLLALHAKRTALPGYAFSPDHEWQRAFERAFPYRETPDQLTAVAQVKQDMERPQPMDRLLLG
ncbi:MAG: transcription-repair coupling factor, partial [Candidatus Omnitrophica bacterium]|nr:transcription-repair coupling factor [Candidatus Omnitrophota bacterium]